ncbi:MAG: hypothetical protein LUI07_09270 [Lachnospiraceae bacterium]|nr:hypothetical protein [Lachnospiraceae bacterium]
MAGLPVAEQLFFYHTGKFFGLPCMIKWYYGKKTASHNAPESGDPVANLSGENPQARFPSDRLYYEKRKNNGDSKTWKNRDCDE